MDFSSRVKRTANTDYLAFLLPVFACAVLQVGCVERAQMDSRKGSAGRGDTVVRAATTDSKGNVIVVGSSYSPGLAIVVFPIQKCLFPRPSRKFHGDGFHPSCFVYGLLNFSPLIFAGTIAAFSLSGMRAGVLESLKFVSTIAPVIVV